MKGKLLTILAAIAVASLFTVMIIFRVDQKVVSQLPWFEDLNPNGTITVLGRNGSYSVSLDGKELGSAPLDSSEVDSGNHTVNLTRDGKENVFYEPATFFVNVQSGTESIIDIEIAPDGYLHGYELYYTPLTLTDSEKGGLTVNSDPADADVFINGELKGNEGVFQELREGSYTVTVNRDSYESIEVPVVITKGLNLNVNAHLLPIPTNLELPESSAEQETENE